MLSEKGCKERRARLWNGLDQKPHWILIADPASLIYFANYHQSPFDFRSSEARSVLILGSDGTAILVADNLLQPFADRAFVDDVVTPIWYRGAESAEHRQALLVRSVLERMEQCTGDAIGVEASSVPIGIIEPLRAKRGSLRSIDVDPVIHRLRRRKDPDELTILRASIAAGEAGQAAAMREIRPGMSELDAYLIVQTASMQAAGDRVIVYGDFVTGPRCERIVGEPTGRVIEKGDLVLFDFSVVVWGYRGDFANTFVCGSKPTDRCRQLFEACIDALQAGQSLLRPGVACRDIDRAVRDQFARAGLLGDFPTHSGHGIGLGHPEPPYLVPDSNETLQAGDVITLEPGQYIEGVAGMRYEHDYLITEDGCERLSNHALTIDAIG